MVDQPEAVARDVRVVVPGAELAGTVWTPRHGARSVVLMLPGSGRANRHNDNYFPEIRAHLLRAGHATASFDKRGVGSSTGNYHGNTITAQVAGAQACLDRLQELTPNTPVGIFGHSQGGWVALEVAAARSVAYVVSNSGPAVGPARQERARRLRQLDQAEQAGFSAAFEQLVTAARDERPFGQVKELIRSLGLQDELMSEYFDDGPRGWRLERSLLAYDPMPALRSLSVPTLMVHGELDEMVPVGESVDALAQLGNDAIVCESLPHADHRLRTEVGVLVDGYVDMLNRFIDNALG